MKPSHVAVGLLGLIAAGLWYAAGGANPPPAQAAEALRVSAPLTHDNLTVYFVHGPDAVDDRKVVTLQEALERGWAVVHETGEVSELAVENLSADHELFIQSGDMIRGGRQDRMIAADLLVPVRSGRVPLPSHCVEQGRWTGRGTEAATHFNKSTNFAVGNEIKLANANRDQSGVWQNVAENQKKLTDTLKTEVRAPESASSFQLTLENPAVVARVGEYETALRQAGESRAGVIGVVFVVNGKVTAAEVYGSNGLFKKAWPKLLAAEATAALGLKTDKACPTPPGAREVEAFLANAGKTDSNPSADGTSNGMVAADADRSRNDGRGGGGRGWNEAGVTVQAGARPLMFANPSRAVIPPNLPPELANLPPDALERLFTPRDTAVTSNLPTPNVNPATPEPRPEPMRQNPNRVVDNVEFQGRGNVAGQAPVPPANPTGNNLNTNRVESTSTLILESRDASKKNAVIHRSYIKK